MSFESDLQKIGVFPKEELNIVEKNKIARNITEKLTTNINELVDDYNELLMRIANCKIYYADILPKFNGVFYYYKNNSIYVDKNLLQVNEYLIHEVIHYLQNFEKISKQIKRVGLCQFLEFKLWGLGINEAVVHYITSKAQGQKVHRINDKEISICTNSENNYKYITSLVAQILFLMGEEEAVESCIKSTQNFETKLYNTFEDNTEKIVKGFDILLEESGKENKDEEKILNTVMTIQETIYKTYFKNILKRVENSKEIDKQVQKLEDFEQILSKSFSNVSWEENFKSFKKEMESNYLRKYIEINKKSNSSLVVYKNALYNLFSKIANFIQTRITKSKVN